jgi:hypothetical protein
MNRLTSEEREFRCERLSVRLERLAQNFQRMSSLASNTDNSEAVLLLIRTSKVFLELTAIDLDVDSVFELAQIQRHLSQWHVHWSEIWANQASRQEISTLPLEWVTLTREIAMVLV